MSSSRREHRKRTHDSDRDSESPHDSKKRKPNARMMWVLRGHYEVAAFSAINNPAKRIEGNTHEHICSNCSTTYQHTHPYQKSEHPQHVKDCPKCRRYAPKDRPRTRSNGASQYGSYSNGRYSNNRNNSRRYNNSYRQRPSYRRRSRSRSRSRSPVARRDDRNSSSTPPRRRKRSR